VKPLNGGSAEIAITPARKSSAVIGIRWMSPPIRSRSRVPQPLCAAPVPVKSSAL